MLWMCVMIAAFVMMALYVRSTSNVRIHTDNKFTIALGYLYETVYNFYSDILGESAGKWVKNYIVALFFVILIANLLSVALDFIAPIFGILPSGDFALMQIIILPTSDMQFNIALALFSTLLLICIQFHSLWLKKFFYDYVPFLWKGYIVLEQGKMPLLLYLPLAVWVKFWDIIISMFLGFLDLVGLLAKVISLAFRLFGNMTSGTMLVTMLIIGVSSMTNALTGFMGGINFPVIIPLIVYMQWLLVASIQAMVFPLLVAIFIRMAMMNGEEQKEQAVA